MTFGGALDPQNRSPAAWELNFTKSHNSEKYAKVAKSNLKSDHRGGTKIDFVSPFASELVVWRRQLAQIRALADPRCKKTSTAGISKTNKLVQNTKSKEKTAWKEPKRNPALKKNAQTLCEAAKPQENIIGERRAPREHKTGLKKKHERGN